VKRESGDDSALTANPGGYLRAEMEPVTSSCQSTKFGYLRLSAPRHLPSEPHILELSVRRDRHL
jgi:hypothetical protein